ncbi:MAG: HAD family phosphatase [Candidatus Acidiferrum sp.]
MAFFPEGDLPCFRFWFHSPHCARIYLVVPVYAYIIRLVHDIAKRSATQGLSHKRLVRTVVFDYGNVLGLEQTLEDMKGMALVCGIPHERFSDLYWKLRSPYDRGAIDGPAYWRAVAGQQELGLSRDQIATLIRLDSESISRPNQDAVQWAKLLHEESVALALLSNMPLELSRHVTKSFPTLSAFEHLIYSCDHGSIKPEPAIYRNCLELLKVVPQDILYFDDRAENVEAAAELGINSILFDTVEKTASRVEGRFEIPVPNYSRYRQSSSHDNSTDRPPAQIESD